MLFREEFNSLGQWEALTIPGVEKHTADPILRWRWKMASLYARGNYRNKSGEDDRQAFGEDLRSEASLAVMGDADDTGEGTTAYLDFIKVRR